jgi:hypothetical protein
METRSGEAYTTASITTAPAAPTSTDVGDKPKESGSCPYPEMKC